MPPRRSARVAAAEELRTSALAPLALALAHLVFSLVPVDARARAACVCRGWRAVLADAAPWTHLDLSERSGVAAALRARGEALLRGAAARAHGQLWGLNVSGLDVPPRVLLAVLAANAHSLRKLFVGHMPREGPHELPSLNELVQAAPSLEVLDITLLSCTVPLALLLMRPAPPLVALRTRALAVDFEGDGSDSDSDEGEADERRAATSLERVRPFAALLADATLQPALWSVRFKGADAQRPAVLDALVDALLSRRLPIFSLLGCTPPAAGPLVRLLRAGTLTTLELLGTDGRRPLFGADDAALVASALRESTTLTELRLCSAKLCRDMPAADTLLHALVGHPSLQLLALSVELTAEPDRIVLGAALAALVAADAPALVELNACCLILGDTAMAPLVAALPHNRHLRVLNISTNRMSEAFARERLLPAVRANTALRKLEAADLSTVPSAALEAEQLVERRTALHDS